MLLNSTEFSEKLETALSNSQVSTIVLSPFIKERALRWIIETTNSSSSKIVARWRKHDLLCGASDFSCYEICKSEGIPFGISLNLHGKVFCVDNQILVGSANLTSRGLALSQNYNDEFGVGFEAGQGDRAKVSNYLNDVIWLDDQLVSLMKEDLEKRQETQIFSEDFWSEAIDSRLNSTVNHLWIHELLFTSPSEILKFNADNQHHMHDYELLGLSIDTLNPEALRSNFVKSNAFRWLQNILKEQRSMSFGALSSRLHDAILDDPTPYRKEIKNLVANLFSWAAMTPEIFETSRPRHSQVIRIKDKNY